MSGIHFDSTSDCTGFRIGYLLKAITSRFHRSPETRLQGPPRVWCLPNYLLGQGKSFKKYQVRNTGDVTFRTVGVDQNQVVKAPGTPAVWRRTTHCRNPYEAFPPRAPASRSCFWEQGSLPAARKQIAVGLNRQSRPFFYREGKTP